jgi:DNA-binding LacI/PurR family transcriptional regulator
MKSLNKPAGHKSTTTRMTAYRQRMRAAGMRPVQIWVPDTRSKSFAATCLKQSQVIAQHDPGGDEIMRILNEGSDWSDI